MPLMDVTQCPGPVRDLTRQHTRPKGRAEWTFARPFWFLCKIGLTQHGQGSRPDFGTFSQNIYAADGTPLSLRPQGAIGTAKVADAVVRGLEIFSSQSRAGLSTQMFLDSSLFPSVGGGGQKMTCLRIFLNLPPRYEIIIMNIIRTY